MKKLITILLLASVATIYGGKYDKNIKKYEKLVEKQEKAIKAHKAQVEAKGTKFTELTQDDYGYQHMTDLEKTKNRYEAKVKYWEGRNEIDEGDHNDAQEIIDELEEMGATREATNLKRRLP